MDAETTKTIANLTTRIEKLERALILLLHTFLRHKDTDCAADQAVRRLRSEGILPEKF
jgi:hypothetical protein